MKIIKAGIYRDVSDADYRADLCPLPSLTQSLCKIIIERSPRHAWTVHPRLNGDWLPGDDTKFDLGNVVHKLVLGRGKDFTVLDCDSWRTNAAKLARDEAAQAGKIAVLVADFERASNMAQATFRQIAKHEDSSAFTNGAAGRDRLGRRWHLVSISDRLAA